MNDGFSLPLACPKCHGGDIDMAPHLIQLGPSEAQAIGTWYCRNCGFLIIPMASAPLDVKSDIPLAEMTDFMRALSDMSSRTADLSHGVPELVKKARMLQGVYAVLESLKGRIP
jgi:hypothetical protein